VIVVTVLYSLTIVDSGGKTATRIQSKSNKTVWTISLYHFTDTINYGSKF